VGGPPHGSSPFAIVGPGTARVGGAVGRVGALRCLTVTNQSPHPICDSQSLRNSLGVLLLWVQGWGGQTIPLNANRTPPSVPGKESPERTKGPPPNFSWTRTPPNFQGDNFGRPGILANLPRPLTTYPGRYCQGNGSVHPHIIYPQVAPWGPNRGPNKKGGNPIHCPQ